MSKKVNTDKQIATLALTTAIKKNDWERLPDLLHLAERYGCSKTLKRKGWLTLGDYLIEQKDHVGGIQAYNSARVTALMNVNILERLLLGFKGFYEVFQKSFSREDLVVFKDVLDRMVEYYRIKKDPKLDRALSIGKSLLQRVGEKIEDALSKEETVATFKVWQIHNALYSNMTVEEVRAELARIVVPTIRDFIEKRKAEKKKKKKSAKAIPEDKIIP